MEKRRNFTAIVIMLGLLSVLFACDRSNDDTVKPIPAKIGKAGKLYSNFSMEQSNNAHKKRFSEVICDIKPGQSILVMENPRWETFKVQLMDGNMGWTDAEYIKPSKRTFVKLDAGSNRHIASNRGAVGKARNIVKEVNEKTAVTRLEEYRDTNKRTGHTIDWTKVRTDDGIEGWIMSSYLFRVPIDTPRFINRKDYRYNMNDFIESKKGESIDEFIAKYKEPSAVKKSAKEDIYYFNNIYLFD